MMKRLVSVLAVLTSFALVPFMSGVAQAGQTNKTTGSVLMSGASQPTQYATFDAFASNPVKGNFSYTNFDPSAASLGVGSGVWVPTNFNLGFAVDPSTSVGATYAMTTVSFTPTSPTSVMFSGTGAVTPGASWLATFTGTVSSSTFTMAMTEINASNTAETYALFATGLVAPDGSVSGTWYDNYGLGRTGTFVIDLIGYEAFHYSVPVAQVTSISGHTAIFSFVIAGTGSVWDGTTIFVKVFDGGTPGAGHDTIGFSVNSGGPFTNYTISGGNLTVFAY